jgi:hypothetical protein
MKTLKFIIGVICLVLATLIIVSSNVIATDFTSGLTSYWTFNDTTDKAVDRFSVTNFSFTETVSHQVGKSGNAFNTTHVLNTQPSSPQGANLIFDDAITTQTISGWVKVSQMGTSKYCGILDSRTAVGVGGISFNFLGKPDPPTSYDGMSIFSGYGADFLTNYVTGIGIVVDVWYYMTVVKSGYNYRWYSNGVNVLNQTATTIVQQGTMIFGGKYSNNCNFILDEWGLWNYNMTYLQVAELNGTGGIYPFSSYTPPTYFYSSLSLNLPPNGNRTINFTRQTTFNFTPIFNETIINCSLYTNETGTFAERANKSGIVNNTVNSLVPSYNTTDSEGSIKWNVRCRGASSDVFATANYTLTIDRTAPAITLNYPAANVYETNQSYFRINYTATDLLSNLYKGNISMYYANKTFIKNLLFYNDLNVSTLNEQDNFNWSELPRGVDYFVELCFSDDEAASPPMKSLKAENTGIFKQNKDELRFTDTETGADITGYLEFSDNSKVSKSDLSLINYKTSDDKHIIYGGSYPTNKIKKDTRLRYRYHSNNEQPLIIVNPSIGLIHSESGGLRNLFIQHRSLLEKGFFINTFYSGSDVIVEFWKDSYKDVIDFDPLVGGLNINCVNSSNITKSYFLNLNASDFYTGENISNFSVTLTGDDVRSGSTTNGTLFFPVKNITYSIAATAKDFIPYSGNLSVGQDFNKTLTFKRNNSVYVNILDEDTGYPIVENVTVRVNNVYGETVYFTTAGFYYFVGLVPADYTFRLTSVSYAERSYNLTLASGTSSGLNAYLAKNTLNTLLTVLDSDTAATIENAGISMQKTINSSWATVESRTTDITGRAQFTYSPSTKYKFTVVKSGYETKEFTLDPILFSSYDVYITRISSTNNTLDYDKVIISINPTTYESGANVFSIMFYSPYNGLLTYGYNLSYPTGAAGATGTAAAGQSFSNAININAQPFDIVTLNYFYQTDTSGFKNFTVTYPINYVNNETGNYTMMANKNKTYGMGLLERVFIATLIIILVVGLGSLFGKTLPSLIMGIFLYGYLSYIGFIPFWIVIFPMIAGILILIFGGDKYG